MKYKNDHSVLCCCVGCGVTCLLLLLSLSLLLLFLLLYSCATIVAIIYFSKPVIFLFSHVFCDIIFPSKRVFGVDGSNYGYWRILVEHYYSGQKNGIGIIQKQRLVLYDLYCFL
jgi:hypothetical protein